MAKYKRNVSNFNYKPQAESRQQHLALCMDRHLRSAAIMIEVTGRQTESTPFNQYYSQMPAVARQQYVQSAAKYIKNKNKKTVML